MADDTFNPADALIRVAHEAIPGVLPLDSDAWQDHQMLGETLSDEATPIVDESIVNNAEAAEPADGPIAVNGDINVNVNPEGHLRYFGNVQRRVDTTSPDTGVYLHRFAPSGTTAVPTTLANWVSRADENPQSFRGGRVKQMELSLEVSGILKAKFGMDYARADYWSPPNSLVDTGGTNAALPRLRGLPTYANWADAVDGDLYVKASVVTGLPGAIDVLVKQSLAASYGATVSPILIGNDVLGSPIWNPLYDSTSGDLVGKRSMPIEAHLPLGTNFAVGDEYRFDRERAIWTPTYPAAPVFSSIFAYIIIDEVVYCIKQFTLTIDRPLTPEECIGGRFPKSVQELGGRAVKISMQRRYLDTSLRKRLETGTPFVFRLECYSGEEIAPGYEHQLFVVCPKVKLQGRTASAESKTSMDEKLDGICYPDPDNADDFVDDCTITIQNSIASAVAT